MAAAACAYVEVGKRSGFAMMGFVMRIWLLLLLWNPDMILTFWFRSLTHILEKIPLSFTSIGIWGIHHCGDHVGYRRTLKVQITKVEKAWPQKNWAKVTPMSLPTLQNMECKNHFTPAGPNGPGTSQSCSLSIIRTPLSQHQPCVVPNEPKTASKPAKTNNASSASSFAQGFTGEVCSPLSPLDKAETSDSFLKLLLVPKFLLLLSTWFN